ncbi:hypothetical protein C0J52_01542 [Blattella germanica]|nr:hypothetical protein C0J52_01542 [Blattella germanica]
MQVLVSDRGPPYITSQQLAITMKPTLSKSVHNAIYDKPRVFDEHFLVPSKAKYWQGHEVLGLWPH